MTALKYFTPYLNLYCLNSEFVFAKSDRYCLLHYNFLNVGHLNFLDEFVNPKKFLKLHNLKLTTVNLKEGNSDHIQIDGFHTKVFQHQVVSDYISSLGVQIFISFLCLHITSGQS